MIPQTVDGSLEIPVGPAPQKKPYHPCPENTTTMQLQTVMPSLRVRDSGNARSQKKSKYDHWQMLQDRMAGMEWADIAEKHGITANTRNRAATTAYHIATNSVACRKLKPHEVEKITKP